MPFLRNCWYAAAWNDEIPDDAPFSRKILNEEVVFFRDSTGSVAAIGNRCPHRFAPMHLGTIVGDALECPYHGLRFDSRGSCIFNPQGDGMIPPRAHVKSYPLVERYGMHWIWMGQPEAANADKIPEFMGMDPATHAINKGYLFTAANYQLMSDNILDLGHIEFLHGEILGSEAVRRAKVDARQDGETVWSHRLTTDEILPPTLDNVYCMDGKSCTRWLEVRWNAPALMQPVVGAVEMGGRREDGLETPGMHLMTPETESTTHYFWTNSRNYRLGDEQLHNMLQEGLAYAFEFQDKPMIVAQQEALGERDFWASEPVILASDAAAVRARRLLAKLIRDEKREVAEPVA